MRLFGKNFRGKKNKSKKGCLHYLGHLKNRQKGDTIPDECLICSRLLECL